MKLSFFLFLLSSFFSSLVYGMEFYFNNMDNNSGFCEKFDKEICLSGVLEGPINTGDFEKVKLFIELTEENERLGYVHISSPGGDLYEAMKIGRMLRDKRITVLMAPEDECHSACVLILAGGVFRFVGGEVGIHSFYSLTSRTGSFDYEKEDTNYSNVASDVEKYLREMRVPVRLLEEMMQVSSSRIKLLSYDEKISLGLHQSIDPVYDQYRRSFRGQ